MPTPFLVVLSLLVVLWAVLVWRRGPQVGLAVACIAAFAMPRWYEIELAGLPFDLRSILAIIGLVGILLHPRGRIRSPLIALDGCIAALVVVHVLSDWQQGESLAWLPLRAYGEWALPYVAGRLCVRDGEDLVKIAPWASAILLAIGALAVFEAVAKLNLFDVVFGSPIDVRGEDGEKFPRNVLRYGMLRALGPTEHSIFYGLLQILLLPWAAIQLRAGLSRPAKTLGAAALIFGVLGTVATLSRGPILGLLLAGGFGLAVWSKWLRWPLAIVALVAAGALVARPAEVLTRLGNTVDEQRFKTDVELYGRRYEMNGTMNRYLIVLAYAPAIKSGGFLGHGTEATNQFPPRVTPLPPPVEERDLLTVPDNAYLMMGLRFGWLGLLSLTLLMTAAIVTACRLVRERSLIGSPGWLAACLFAAAAILLTVYPSYDYVFELLFTVGLVGGLRSFGVASERGRPVR